MDANIEIAVKDKERLFNLYKNAVTTDTVHIAGQRMLIAKEYKQKYGTNLRTDLYGGNPPSNRPQSFKVIKTVKPKKSDTTKELFIAKMDEVLERFEDHNKKMDAMVEFYKERSENDRKEYALRLETLQNQVKLLDKKIRDKGIE